MILASQSVQTLRELAPNEIHPTAKKLRAFSGLPLGWHYGQGMTFLPDLLERAQGLHAHITSLGLYETDAFPGIDGSVLLTVYEGADRLELTLNPNGNIDYRREKNDIEILGRENLQLAEVQDILREFRRETCRLSGFYTAGTSIIVSNALLPTHSHLSGALFLLLMKNAS
jgi:hypothetical protein